MTALCLRILQAALVHVNTLMLQDVRAGDDWSELLAEADRRGLTPTVLAACAALRGGPAGHGITAAHRRFRLACAWCAILPLGPGGATGDVPGAMLCV
jgi:hypothetical protein